MKLGVCVMAHPDRDEWAVDLAKSLRSSPAEVVAIEWDTENSIWDTARKTLLASQRTLTPTTHWLVLQDDAIVCEDLVEGTLQALRYIPPASALSLYLGRKQPFDKILTPFLRDGRRDDISFVRMHRVNWGVGVVYPTIQIPKMIAYLEKRGPDTKTVRYDLQVSNWYLYTGIPVYYTWPSLVDHRNAPSLMGHSSEGRHAFRFHGASNSALTLDWTKGSDSVQISKRRP